MTTARTKQTTQRQSNENGFGHIDVRRHLNTSTQAQLFQNNLTIKHDHQTTDIRRPTDNATPVVMTTCMSHVAFSHLIGGNTLRLPCIVGHFAPTCRAKG